MEESEGWIWNILQVWLEPQRLELDTQIISMLIPIESWDPSSKTLEPLTQSLRDNGKRYGSVDKALNHLCMRIIFSPTLRLLKG
jgi:hypothetical protein